MDDPNEKRLIEKLRSSDRKKNNEALKQVYEKGFEKISSFLRKYQVTKEDVKDIFQDAIIVLFNKLKDQDFELNCSINTYLFSVSKNILFKRLRTKGRVVALDDEVVVDENEIFAFEKSEFSDHVISALNQLGEDCKKVLLLFYYEKLSMKRIAEQLHYSSEQIAKNKKYTCMNNLKKQLRGSTYFREYHNLT